MSDEAKQTGIARISITVEVTVGAWGGECTLRQVWDSAKRDAIDRLANALQKHTEIRMVGEPVVTAVVAPERR